jgi:predicted CoA-binding protein
MALPERVVALLEPAELTRSNTRIALVGASNDRSKYGNIILRDLVRKGFTVLPVNPSEHEVQGLPSVRRVAELADPVHIVNFVVPPEVSLEVLGELDPSRFRVVWFQPGAYDGRVVDAARQRFESVVAGDCIMVET